MSKTIESFTGMHRQGVGFLDALSFQNDPIFFNANKSIFIDHIKSPLISLCKELEPYINKIDSNLDTRPTRTICRIRRDARFAKGVPYRDNMWISYKPVDRSNSDYFTYYFYFDTKSYGMGVGFYGVQRQMMKAFRDRIEANVQLFIKILNETNINSYNLSGENYKRPIKKITLSNDIMQWYNKKSFFVGTERPIDDILFSPQLLDDIVKVYMDLVPLYDFVLGHDVRFKI